MSLTNFSWVLPQVIGGCECPSKESQVRELVDIGCTLLVTLSADRLPHTSIQSLQHIRNEVFPCNNYEGVPVSTMIKIVNSIETEVSREGKVVVHCRFGQGRTGTVLAALVMKRQNMSSKEAMNFVRKLRPYSIETRTQEKCLEDYEKFLLSQNSP